MICYAAYFLVSKPLVARYDSITSSTYVMLFAALGVLPIGVPALPGGDFHGISPTVWLLVAYVVLGPTIGAYLLNLWALRRASSITVATFMYLQPLFAAAVAPLVLPGESPTGRTVLAALTIFAGFGLGIRAEQRQRLSLILEPGVGE